jgi:hypothetical protein
MLSLGEWLLNRAPAAHRAVAAPPGHFVEHLLGERAVPVLEQKQAAGQLWALSPAIHQQATGPARVRDQEVDLQTSNVTSSGL